MSRLRERRRWAPPVLVFIVCVCVSCSETAPPDPVATEPILDAAALDQVIRGALKQFNEAEETATSIGSVADSSPTIMADLSQPPMEVADAARRGGPFVEALREQRASVAPRPVFHGVKGGTQRVIDALHDELSNHIYMQTPAVSLERHGRRWRVTTPAGSFDGDRVIITTPGFVSAPLLEPHSPEAASLLAGLAYSDAVLVTFVVPSKQVGHSLDGAGFLVPRDQGLLMTACSWSSSKWNHYDDGSHAILRVSAGRVDDRRWLALDESTLVETLRQELAATIGLQGEVAVRVTPWRRSLPQYLPGHLQRCDQIDTCLQRDTPGVTVTGASMRGLGLPACVRQTRTATTL